jgi:hypothetical protein
MSTTGSPEGPTRIEREILEILERAEAEKHPVDDIQAAVRRRSARTRAKMQSAARHEWALSWSSDLVRIGAALLLAIAAALTANVSNFLAVFLAVASGAALLSLWFRAGPGGPGDRPRWRGQDLDGPGGSSPFGGNGPRSWRWPGRSER